MQDDKISQIIHKNRPLLRQLVQSLWTERGSFSADDLEQEIWLKLVRLMSNENNLQLNASYIRRVVNTTIIDTLRKLAARPDANSSEAANASSPATTEDLNVDHQLIEQIDEVIGSLGQNRSIAVRLHIQGYNSREIAKITGWSEAKARNLSSRGIKALRVKLNEMGIDYENT